MKKTSLIVSLLVVFTLAISACAPKAEEAAVDEGFSVAYLTDLGGLAGSDEVKGFSDLGWDAAIQAEEELGITKVLLEANELADLEPNLVKNGRRGPRSACLRRLPFF